MRNNPNMSRDQQIVLCVLWSLSDKAGGGESRGDLCLVSFDLLCAELKELGGGEVVIADTLWLEEVSSEAIGIDSRLGCVLSAEVVALAQDGVSSKVRAVISLLYGVPLPACVVLSALNESGLVEYISEEQSVKEVALDDFRLRRASSFIQALFTVRDTLQYASECFHTNHFLRCSKSLWLAKSFNRTCSRSHSGTVNAVILDLHRNVPMSRIAEALLTQKCIEGVSVVVCMATTNEGLKEGKAYLLRKGLGNSVKFIKKSEFYGLSEGCVQNYSLYSDLEDRYGKSEVKLWSDNDRSLSNNSVKGVYHIPRSPFSHDHLRLIVEVVHANIQSFLKTINAKLYIGLDVNALWKHCLISQIDQSGAQLRFLLPTRVESYLAFSDSPYEQFSFVTKYERKYASDYARRYAGRYVESHLLFNRRYHDSSQLGSVTTDKLLGRSLSEEYVSKLEHLRATASRKQRKLRKDNALSVINMNPIEAWDDAIVACRNALSIDERSYPFKRLTDLEAIFEQPRVFYAFQSEPETAVSLYGQHLPAQGDIIRAVWKALPPGVSLIAKDHPRMFRLRRPSYYEELLADCPGLTILDPRDDALKLVPKVKVIVTIAGTVGMEGLMFGVPTISLGAAHYQHLYGILPIRSLTDLGKVLNEVISDDWDRNRMEFGVRDYIAQCIENGYPIGWWSDIRPDAKYYDYESEEFQGFVEFFVKGAEEIRCSGRLTSMRPGIDLDEA